MARSIEFWKNVRRDCEINSLSFEKLANIHAVALSTISVRAKKEHWIKGKIEGAKEKKINAVKMLMDVEEEIEGLELEPREATDFDKLVNNELEMRGLYQSFERQLVLKAAEQLNKYSPGEENAVDNVVKITTAIKNIKPPAPKSVINNSQTNNSQTNNTLNLTLDEEKQELMNILSAYD